MSNKLPNHISEAFLVARSKYKNILSTVSLGKGGGGGGEIPKGGRAGRAKSLGITDGGGGGAKSLGHWNEIP